MYKEISVIKMSHIKKTVVKKVLLFFKESFQRKSEEKKMAVRKGVLKISYRNAHRQKQQLNGDPLREDPVIQQVTAPM